MAEIDLKVFLEFGKKTFYKLEVPCITHFSGCIDAVVKSRLKTHNDFFKIKKGERKK